MVTKAISSPDFLVVIRLTVPTMPTMVVMVPSGSSPSSEMRWPASRRIWCRMSLSGCELTYRPSVSFSRARSSSLLKSSRGISTGGLTRCVRAPLAPALRPARRRWPAP